MNNLQANGWDLTDIKHIELGEPELDRYRLLKGDLLFNRTNSKELVGKCEAFNEDGDWVFASYLIRVRVDTGRVLPQFVSAFLNCSAGRIQIDQVSRQIAGMTNVNAEELRLLEVPLPPLEVQRRLVAELDVARAERDRALAEAEKLTVTFDAYLLNELGLALPDENTQKTFAVRLGAIRGGRIDPPAYQPILARGVTPRVPVKALSVLAVVNNHNVEKPEDAKALVPYVGLPECDQTEVREVVMRPYSEVKGRSVVKPGDILFARIEPSIFNKKYVLVEDLKGHDHAYTSTEFYVVSHRPGISVQEYLYAMFFCSFVYSQSKGMTTGSSGRRRLDLEQFRSLKIPVPDLRIQQIIADEAIRRRQEARYLRVHAETVWREARERFEQQLLQGGNT